MQIDIQANRYAYVQTYKRVADMQTAEYILRQTGRQTDKHTAGVVEFGVCRRGWSVAKATKLC